MKAKRNNVLSGLITFRITKAKAKAKFGEKYLCGHECERSSVLIDINTKAKTTKYFGGFNFTLVSVSTVHLRYTNIFGNSLPSWTKRCMHDRYFLELINVNTACELHVRNYLKLFSWLLHAYHSPTCEQVPAHVRDTSMKFWGIKNVSLTCWLHVEYVSESIMYLLCPLVFCAQLCCATRLLRYWQHLGTTHSWVTRQFLFFGGGGMKECRSKWHVKHPMVTRILGWNMPPQKMDYIHRKMFWPNIL